MADEGRGSASAWGSLIRAPLEVIKKLEGEPILLVAMGGAVLVGLIAIFATEEGILYAGLLAGVVIVAMLLRHWFGSGTATHGPVPARRGNIARFGRRSTVGRVRLWAANGKGNWLRTGSRVHVEDLKMTAGASPSSDREGPDSPEAT